MSSLAACAGSISGLVTAESSSRSLSAPLRFLMAPVVRVLMWLFLPILLRTSLRLPDNAALANLSLEEARETYIELGKIHAALDSIVQNKDRFRLLLRWSSVEDVLDRVEDIREALAWAIDPELRGHLEEAVNQVAATGVLR